MNFDCYLTKSQNSQIVEINVKDKTITFQDDKLSEHFQDLGRGKSFLNGKEKKIHSKYIITVLIRWERQANGVRAV